MPSEAARIPSIKPLLFLSCMALILLIPIKTPLNFYDEGFAVLNGTRLIAGDAPYKDIWAIYPPGQQYTLAAIFAIFGSSLLAARVYDTLVRVVIVAAVYFIARRIGSPLQAYLAGLITTLLLTSVSFYAYAAYPALALGLLAFSFTLNYSAAPRLRWLLSAGLLAGIAGFYRWDIGLYASLGLGAAVFCYQLVAGRRAPSPWLTAAFKALKSAVVFLTASFGVLAAGYGLVSVNSGARNVWEQVILFPATRLHAVRWLSYPALIPSRWPDLVEFRQIWSEPLNWLRFYLPLAVYGLALLYSTYTVLVRRAVLNSKIFGLTAAALFGGMLFSQALSRYDYIHVLPAMIVALLAVLALYAQVSGKPGGLPVKIGLFILLPALAISYFTAPLAEILSTLDAFPPWGCYSQVERASCASIGENQQNAVEFVRASTQAGEPIYVGNTRHDLVFVSDVSFYFLADRPPATRYSELHPGVATTQPVQEEIAAELDAKNVRILVLVDMWLSSEPNDSAVSSGVTYLDSFIRSKFSRMVEFGEYQVWQRIKP